MGGDGIDEEIRERGLEEASKASTSFDQWEEHAMEGQISKPIPPSYGYDSSQGLSKSFRITIVTGSVLIMVAVILALAVFLPHGADSSKKRSSNDRKLIGIGELGIRDLACRAAQFRQVCRSSLRHSAAAGPVDILMASMEFSSEGLTQSREFIISDSRPWRGDSKLAAAVQNCLELLEASKEWISRSKAAVSGERKEGIRAWLGAALRYQTDCSSALRQANATGKFASGAMKKINRSAMSTANALNLFHALDAYGSDAKSWRRQEINSLLESNAKLITEHMEGFRPQVPKLGEIIPNVTVSRDGSSPYSSIQDAVDSAPDNCSHQRFVIHIKAGVYEETVLIPRNKVNILLIGDGADRTVVTGSPASQDPGGSARGSATLVYFAGVDGNAFAARDIAFENRAGPAENQAVALRVDGDLSVFQNCSMLGHHGTLYARALRQIYRDCRIEGTGNLIFGNAASIFQNCTIFVRPLRVSIPGRGDTGTDAAAVRSAGFVFRNCSLH